MHVYLFRTIDVINSLLEINNDIYLFLFDLFKQAE